MSRLTVRDVADRARTRWKGQKKSEAPAPFVKIKLPAVELIPEARLSEPLRGDIAKDRWSNNFDITLG